MSVESEANQGPRIRIGELSRRTGVGVDTLRAWERRHGVLEPTRSDGGSASTDRPTRPGLAA